MIASTNNIFGGSKKRGLDNLTSALTNNLKIQCLTPSNGTAVARGSLDIANNSKDYVKYVDQTAYPSMNVESIPFSNESYIKLVSANV